MVDEPDSEDELSVKKRKNASSSSRFKANIIKNHSFKNTDIMAP